MPGTCAANFDNPQTVAKGRLGEVPVRLVTMTAVAAGDQGQGVPLHRNPGTATEKRGQTPHAIEMMLRSTFRCAGSMRCAAKKPAVPAFSAQ
jgi:hypothetical protein